MVLVDPLFAPGDLSEAKGARCPMRNTLLAIRGKLNSGAAEKPLDISAAALEEFEGFTPSFALPSGWEWVTGKKLFSFVTSGSRGWAEYYSNDGPIFLRIGNLDYRTTALDLSSVQRVRPPANAEGTRTKVQAGDVLISITGDTGMVGVAPDDLGEAYINQHIALARPDRAAFPQFVGWALVAPSLLGRLQRAQRGIKNSLGLGDIGSLSIPLPPLAEQKRIVAKVDQLMALCDDLEAKQTKKRDLATQSTHSALTALTTAETGSDVTVAWERLARNFGDALRNAEDISAFREAVVALAVQGRLTSALSAAKPRSTAKSEPSPEPWPSLSLGEIVVAMDAGWSPNCPPCATETEKEWGVLRTTAVQRNRFLPEHHKALPPGLLPRPQLEVTPGDLLVTRAGPTARVGIACAVSDVRGRLMLSDKIIRAKLDARRADAEYVALALNSGMSREFLRASQSGMDLAQVNISQDRLRKVPISLPSLAEQRRIVAKVDDLMSLLDDLEAKLRKQEETATRLAESLAAAVAA